MRDGFFFVCESEECVRESDHPIPNEIFLELDRERMQFQDGVNRLVVFKDCVDDRTVLNSAGDFRLIEERPDDLPN